MGYTFKDIIQSPTAIFDGLTASLPLKLNGSKQVLAQAIDLSTAEVTGTLPITLGGTGLASLGTANQLLRVNAGGTALEYFTFSGSTSGIDDVLAIAQQLTTARAIDINGNTLTISNGSLLNLGATEIRLNSTLAGTSNGYVWTLTDNSTGAGEWAAPAGGGSGLTVGTTTITSGTDTRVLFDNAGVLGEYTISGTGSVAMTTSPTFTTPNIGVASGTSVTLSSLTSGRVPIIGTSGLITDDSALTYDTSNSVLTAGGFYANTNLTSPVANGLYLYYNPSNNTAFIDSRQAPSYVPKSMIIYASDLTFGINNTNTAKLVGGKMFLGGVSTATATLHLAAGTTTATTAPLKFTQSGSALLTTPEGGAVEDNGTHIYWTDSGGTRYQLDQQSGGSGYTVVNVTSTTYNATQTSGEIILLVDATTAGGAVTVNLPTAVGNTAKFSIKKIDSGTDTVTIDADTTEEIDGNTTAIMTTQYTSVTIISDNSNWFII